MFTSTFVPDEFPELAQFADSEPSATQVGNPHQVSDSAATTPGSTNDFPKDAVIGDDAGGSS